MILLSDNTKRIMIAIGYLIIYVILLLGYRISKNLNDLLEVSNMNPRDGNISNLDCIIHLWQNKLLLNLIRCAQNWNNYLEYIHL